MENSEFINDLSQRMHRPGAECQSLVDALVEVIRENCGATASVALPGLGKFTGVKKPESVQKDTDTGKNILLPPSIQINFTAATSLRRRISRR